MRDAAETAAILSGGGAWERLLARSISGVRYGIENPGHYKVLFEGRIVPRLIDQQVSNLGQPLMIRSTELIRSILSTSENNRVSEDPERLAYLLWSGLHGIISLSINKPTQAWPPIEEMVEQMVRAIVVPN